MLEWLPCLISMQATGGRFQTVSRSMRHLTTIGIGSLANLKRTMGSENGWMEIVMKLTNGTNDVAQIYMQKNNKKSLDCKK